MVCTLTCTYLVNVYSMRSFSNFVCFSESPNFINTYEKSLHYSRLVDGTLEKICGEFIDHEKSIFLLALHGSHPAIGWYD